MRLAMSAWADRNAAFVDGLTTLLQALLIIGMTIFLIELPIMMLLLASKLSSYSGEGVDAVIRLSLGAKAILAGTLALMALASTMVAGFARHFLQTRAERLWAVSLPVIVAFGLFLWVGHVFRTATGLIAAHPGDNPLVFGFLAAWALIVGYVCKVPWDEARDRWQKSAERFWTVTVVPGVGGSVEQDDSRP